MKRFWRPRKPLEVLRAQAQERVVWEGQESCVQIFKVLPTEESSEGLLNPQQVLSTQEGASYSELAPFWSFISIGCHLAPLGQRGRRLIRFQPQQCLTCVRTHVVWLQQHQKCPLMWESPTLSAMVRVPPFSSRHIDCS